MIVERTIPERFLDGLGKGIYKLYGGTIHDVNTGKIVGHLSIGNEKMVQSTGTIGGLSHLIGATAALSALNLAVTAVGFTVVISKLDQLNKKLDEIEKLNQEILAEVHELKYYNKLREISDIVASIENLKYALETKNNNTINNVFNSLNHNLKFYVFFVEEYLKNINYQEIYSQPEFVKYYLEAITYLWVLRAKIMALQGNTKQSVDYLGELDAWQNKHLEIIKEPLYLKRKPLWLQSLSQKQKDSTKQLLRWQTDANEGIRYLQSQYQFCLLNNITLDQLASNTNKHDLAFFVIPEYQLQ